MAQTHADTQTLTETLKPTDPARYTRCIHSTPVSENPKHKEVLPCCRPEIELKLNSFRGPFDPPLRASLAFAPSSRTSRTTLLDRLLEARTLCPPASSSVAPCRLSDSLMARGLLSAWHSAVPAPHLRWRKLRICSSRVWTHTPHTHAQPPQPHTHTPTGSVLEDVCAGYSMRI